MLRVRTTLLRWFRLVVSPLKLVLGLVHSVHILLRCPRVPIILEIVLLTDLCMARLGPSRGLRGRQLTPTLGRGCVLFLTLPLTFVTTCSRADPFVLPRFRILTPVLGKKSRETPPKTRCPGGIIPLI